MEKMATIFTDGACRGNPGPGGWGAIVLFPDSHVQELGESHPQTSNNQMELTAALKALEGLKDLSCPVALYTDSQYLINGIERWLPAWERKQWQTAQGKDVAHQELWKALAIEKKKRTVRWNYIPGHANYPGNDRCDEIAVAFAKGKSPPLYSGPQARYKVDLSIVPKKFSSRKGPYYLSYVHGKLFRDYTWATCQQRVQGVSAARFKKCRDGEEEERIRQKWGISKDLTAKEDTSNPS